MKLTSLIGVLTLLVNSAAADPIQLPDYVKTIGVIPRISDEGRLFHVALVRFLNECKPFKLKSANLDSVVFNTAASVLGRRFKLVRLTYTRQLEPNAGSQESGLFRSSPKLGEQIRRLIGTPVKVDAFLLVGVGQSGGPCTDDPRAYGAGLTTTVAAARVHAYGQMTLVDAHTNETLQTVSLREAAAPFSGFEWTGKPTELSEQQMKILSAALQKVLAEALAKALRETLPGQF